MSGSPQQLANNCISTKGVPYRRFVLIDGMYYNLCMKCVIRVFISTFVYFSKFCNVFLFFFNEVGQVGQQIDQCWYIKSFYKHFYLDLSPNLQNFVIQPNYIRGVNSSIDGTNHYSMLLKIFSKIRYLCSFKWNT
jgi:hypothetical protein